MSWHRACRPLLILRIWVLTAFHLLGSTSGWEHVDPAHVRTQLQNGSQSLIAFVCSPTCEEPAVCNPRDANLLLESEWASVQRAAPNALSVDCNVENEFCQSLGVLSFPAIRLYREDGSVARYRGPPESERVSFDNAFLLALGPSRQDAHSELSIKDFLHRASRPFTTRLEAEEVASFLSADEITFLASLTLPADQGVLDRFEALAGRYSDRFSFGIVLQPPSTNQVAPRISCHSALDDRELTLSDVSTVQSLADFVKRCSTPVIPQMTRRNEMSHLQSGKSLLCFVSATDRERNEYVKAMLPLAKKYDEYLVFVTVDSGEYPDMAQILGLQPNSLPGLSVQHPATGQVFPFRGKSIKPDSIEAFIIDISSGKIQSWDGNSAAGGTSLGMTSYELAACNQSLTLDSTSLTRHLWNILTLV